ncbi:MAG: protein kinase [Planctomycetes bacterium]|nr:protein kinase [Planctomycetota bacterium]
MAESVPQILANCRIMSKLGQGGMGSVYRAVHTTLGRPIALKVLPVEFTRSPEYVARFMREARAVANLSHPNIVNVHDAGEQNGIYYIAMELVDGASMGALTHYYRPLSEVECLNFLLQAAKGLAAAHARGLVHRDLKPENLLVSREGYLKIVDFGLVLEQSSDSHLTRTGTFLGTPTYMSPEQCDSETADARSDLYSLGATFFSALTGKPPFQAPTALGILYKHKFEQPPDPRSLVPDLTEASAKILLKLLNKKREDRQQNAQELIEEVEKAQKGVAGKENTWSLKEALGNLKPAPDLPLVFAATPSPNPVAAYTPTVLPGNFDPRSATGMPTGGTPAPLSSAPGQTPVHMVGTTPARQPSASGFEPTLLTGGNRTPVAQGTPASSGFEPTMISAGKMAAQQASGATPSPLQMTPAPAPLQELPTPTVLSGPQAQQAKASKVPLLAAAAAVLLLVVGLGAYFGYEMLQKKQQLSKYKSDIQQFIEEGDLEKAERARKAALVKFSDDTELQNFESRILAGFVKRAESELTKDVTKAGEAVRSGLQFFPDDKTLKDLQQKVLTGYVAAIEKAIKEAKDKDARALLAAAFAEFPGNYQLGELQQQLSDRHAEQKARFGDALKKGIEAFQGGDYPAAEDHLLEAAKYKPTDPELETKLRKPLFDYYMKTSTDAAKGEKWQDALEAAKKAGAFGSADEAVQTCERRIKIEAVRTDADAANKKGDWRGAALKLLDACTLTDEKKDTALKAQLTQQAAALRSAGFEREIQDAEKALQWDKASKRIEEALQVMGPNDALSQRLQTARNNFAKSTTFADAMKSGDESMGKKNWADARNSFQAALNIKKNDATAQAKFTEADVRFQIENGNSLFAAQNWTNAKEVYQSAELTANALSGAEYKDLKDSLKRYIEQVDQRVKDLEQSEKDAARMATEGKLAEAIRAYEALKTLNKSKQGGYDSEISRIKREDQYRSWLKNGDDAVQLGKFAEARDDYRKALEKKADDSQVKDEIAKRQKNVDAQEKFQAGETAWKVSDWRKAKTGYEDAQAAYPEAPKDFKDLVKKQLDAVNARLKQINDADAKAAMALKDKRFDLAEAGYKELLTLDPLNKTLYDKAIADLQPKIAEYKSQLDKKQQEDEDRRKKEAELQAKKDRYANNIAVAKQKINGRDYDGAENALKAALAEFPEDSTAKQMQLQIEELRKRHFDQQGENEVWNKVEPLAKQGQYAAAKQQADEGVRQNPALADTVKPWSDALNALASADAAADAASKALDDGLRVNNLTGEAQGALTRGKADLRNAVTAAQRSFLGKNYNDAQRSANDAAVNAKRSAREALSSAAESCSAQARAERASGGGGNTGGKPPRHDNAGEGDLPGTEAPAPKGDERKAKAYDDAAKALQQIANGLR